MGLANAQRISNVLRQLVNFAAQPQYANVIWCAVCRYDELTRQRDWPGQRA